MKREQRYVEQRPTGATIIEFFFVLTMAFATEMELLAVAEQHALHTWYSRVPTDENDSDILFPTNDDRRLATRCCYVSPWT